MDGCEARLLRLYMNADDRTGRKPLYEAVVLKAREMGLAGVSVFAEEVGYGSDRVVHDAMSEYTSVGAPLVVEVVDAEERIRAFLGECAALFGGGLVTVSRVSRLGVVRSVARSGTEGISDGD